MTTIVEPPAPAVEAPTQGRLDRAEGVELLGPVHGSGYRDGAALVRRGDGQMVQLGSLMYALLESVDGRREMGELAAAMSERLGRQVAPEHVTRLGEKLAAQGLLAGTEHKAPPRRNPLLALRWKVLVTNPRVTRLLTAPFTVLFRPWLMWPILAGFVGVFWFVLIHKGVASATTQAFQSPGLLLLVFALAVASAGFHELGHAAACRYGGATPAGMGMGMYLVWPAFYTDVTDAYRLPRRARLRVDLGGLYFNAVVAVATLGLWLVWRQDALLLLVALQVLQMVKQLSPVIRSDGYHILADVTGVPDLYAHMGPTMRRLLPHHRHERSALTGRARLLVTLWVLIVVPVLLSLTITAVLLLPHLGTTAWDSGHQIATGMPDEASHGQIVDVAASLIRLLALCLPVLGSVLVTQKLARTTAASARSWSRGRPRRQALVAGATALIIAGLAWAWWPSGQYQPVRATQGGTLGDLAAALRSPGAVARPLAPPMQAHLTPGTHLALSMIPVGGATKDHPAVFVIGGQNGQPAVAILSGSAPDPGKAAGGTFTGPPGTVSGAGAPAGSLRAPSTPVTSAPGEPSSSSTPVPTGTGTPTDATAFPFTLPSRPGPGGSQALSVNTTNGAVKYDVAYSLVTVSGGAPVTQSNSAFALAHCRSCTTIAVAVQVVLIVGRSKVIAPIDAAGALNYDCPACITTAIADQIVVTLTSQPPKALMARLETVLERLKALPALGANGSPAAVAATVAAVQGQITTELDRSGLLANSGTTTSASSSANPATSTSSTTSVSPQTPSTTTATTPSPQPGATTTRTSTSTSTTTTSSTTTPSATSTTTTTAPTSTTSTTTTVPSSGTDTTGTTTSSSSRTPSTATTTTAATTTPTG